MTRTKQTARKSCGGMEKNKKTRMAPTMQTPQYSSGGMEKNKKTRMAPTKQTNRNSSGGMVNGQRKTETNDGLEALKTVFTNDHPFANNLDMLRKVARLSASETARVLDSVSIASALAVHINNDVDETMRNNLFPDKMNNLLWLFVKPVVGDDNTTSFFSLVEHNDILDTIDHRFGYNEAEFKDLIEAKLEDLRDFSNDGLNWRLHKLDLKLFGDWIHYFASDDGKGFRVDYINSLVEVIREECPKIFKATRQHRQRKNRKVGISILKCGYRQFVLHMNDFLGRYRQFDDPNPNNPPPMHLVFGETGCRGVDPNPPSNQDAKDCVNVSAPAISASEKDIATQVEFIKESIVEEQCSIHAAQRIHLLLLHEELGESHTLKSWMYSKHIACFEDKSNPPSCSSHIENTELEYDHLRGNWSSLNCFWHLHQIVGDRGRFKSVYFHAGFQQITSSDNSNQVSAEIIDEDKLSVEAEDIVPVIGPVVVDADADEDVVVDADADEDVVVDADEEPSDKHDKLVKNFIIGLARWNFLEDKAIVWLPCIPRVFSALCTAKDELQKYYIVEILDENNTKNTSNCLMKTNKAFLKLRPYLEDERLPTDYNTRWPKDWDENILREMGITMEETKTFRWCQLTYYADRKGTNGPREFVFPKKTSNRNIGNTGNTNKRSSGTNSAGRNNKKNKKKKGKAVQKKRTDNESTNNNTRTSDVIQKITAWRANEKRDHENGTMVLVKEFASLVSGEDHKSYSSQFLDLVVTNFTESLQDDDNFNELFRDRIVVGTQDLCTSDVAKLSELGWEMAWGIANDVGASLQEGRVILLSAIITAPTSDHQCQDFLSFLLADMISNNGVTSTKILLSLMYHGMGIDLGQSVNDHWGFYKSSNVYLLNPMLDILVHQKNIVEDIVSNISSLLCLGPPITELVLGILRMLMARHNECSWYMDPSEGNELQMVTEAAQQLDLVNANLITSNFDVALM